MNTDGAYYYYNNQSFLTRESAFEAMLINKDYNSSLEFHFYENVFRNLEWTINPNVSIDTLYKMRAQQLRDKYKYLILAFSGGSDSTQILKTCLKHNIFIDEVQITHHSSLINKVDRNLMMTDSELSQFLEYDYAVKPLLKYISEKSPNTKITSLDASDFTVEQYQKQKFKHINSDDDVPNNTQKLYSFMPKTTLYYLNYYNMRINNPPSESCLIRGFEKPIINVTEDRSLVFLFNDMILHSFSKKIFDNFAIENFYWSPDAPLIPIKQAHLIKEFMEINKILYALVYDSVRKIQKHQDDRSYSPAIMIERAYSKIIYPDFDSKTFAAFKPIKIPPEFKLLKELSITHHTQEFLKELGQEKENKFSKINNKKQFRSILFTKPYYIGKINPRWN